MMLRIMLLGQVALLVVASTATAAELPTGTGWHEIPNTRLQSICAGENGFPQVLGASGCSAITAAWSGGIFDTLRNRMIIFGGGHNDYYGNELYAFNVETQTIERLTDPGLPTADSCTEAIAGGSQPNSRHTYDGIEYIEAADKMFVFGGSLACGAGNFGDDTWTFDFQAREWQRMDPAGPTPYGDAGIMTAYDPISGLVYLHDRRNLFSFDIEQNLYTQLSTSQTNLGYHLAATIHPKLRKFVIVGYDSVQGSGRVYTYDIGPNSNYEQRRLTTNGGSAIVGDAYPGLAYDPATENIHGWSGGNNVYALDLGTGEWESTSGAGAPATTPNGTHGRWRYSPGSEVFVSVNRMDSNIYIWRSSSEPVIKPSPPSALDAQ